MYGLTIRCSAGVGLVLFAKRDDVHSQFDNAEQRLRASSRHSARHPIAGFISKYGDRRGGAAKLEDGDILDACKGLFVALPLGLR